MKKRRSPNRGSSLFWEANDAMDENKMAIQGLIDFIEETDGFGIAAWPQYEVEDFCYSRWAANELVTAILEHPLEPVRITIESFANKMSDFACIKEDTIAERIFLTAAEFAYECLENLHD